MTNRELDALIREKVMGEECKKGGSWYSTGGEWREWTPSSDMSHAWEVVEKMDVLGWCCQIANNTVGDEKFSAHFWWNKMYASKMAFANSPSKAICLAALKAVGVEVEN